MKKYVSLLLATSILSGDCFLSFTHAANTPPGSPRDEKDSKSSELRLSPQSEKTTLLENEKPSIDVHLSEVPVEFGDVFKEKGDHILQYVLQNKEKRELILKVIKRYKLITKDSSTYDQKLVFKCLGQLQTDNIENALFMIFSSELFANKIEPHNKLLIIQSLGQLEKSKSRVILKALKDSKLLDIIIDDGDRAKLITSLGELENSKIKEVIDVIHTYMPYVPYNPESPLDGRNEFYYIKALAKFESGKIKPFVEKLIEAIKQSGLSYDDFQKVSDWHKKEIINAFSQFDFDQINEVAKLCTAFGLTENIKISSLTNVLNGLKTIEADKLIPVLECIKKYELNKPTCSIKSLLINLGKLETKKMIALVKVAKAYGLDKSDDLGFLIKRLSNIDTARIPEAFEAIKAFNLTNNKQYLSSNEDNRAESLFRLITSLIQIDSGKVHQYTAATLDVLNHHNLSIEEIDSWSLGYIIGALGKCEVNKIKEIVGEILKIIDTYKLFETRDKIIDDQVVWVPVIPLKGVTIAKICQSFAKVGKDKFGSVLKAIDTYKLFSERMSQYQKYEIMSTLCDNFEKMEESLKFIKKYDLCKEKSDYLRFNISAFIEISENKEALEAIDTYGLLSGFNRKYRNDMERELTNQLELIRDLFGKEGLCLLNNKIKAKFFLSHLREWQHYFFKYPPYHTNNKLVMKALHNLRENSIKEFLIDLYQSVDINNYYYVKHRLELASIWFSVSPEELGFEMNASKRNHPQHDKFIKKLYSTGLKILSEIGYDPEAKKMISIFMRRFITNGDLKTKISTEYEKTLSTISLTEENFEDTLKLLDMMRSSIVK